MPSSWAEPVVVAACVAVAGAIVSLVGGWLPKPSAMEHHPRLSVAFFVLLVALVGWLATLQKTDEPGLGAGDMASAEEPGVATTTTVPPEDDRTSTTTSPPTTITTTPVPAGPIAIVGDRPHLRMGAFRDGAGGLCVTGVLDGGVVDRARLLLWEDDPRAGSDYSALNTVLAGNEPFESARYGRSIWNCFGQLPGERRFVLQVNDPAGGVRFQALDIAPAGLPFLQGRSSFDRVVEDFDRIRGATIDGTPLVAPLPNPG